jgi:hypothetical protein
VQYSYCKKLINGPIEHPYLAGMGANLGGLGNYRLRGESTVAILHFYTLYPVTIKINTFRVVFQSQ